MLIFIKVKFRNFIAFRFKAIWGKFFEDKKKLEYAAGHHKIIVPVIF